MGDVGSWGLPGRMKDSAEASARFWTKHCRRGDGLRPSERVKRSLASTAGAVSGRGPARCLAMSVFAYRLSYAPASGYLGEAG